MEFNLHVFSQQMTKIKVPENRQPDIIRQIIRQNQKAAEEIDKVRSENRNEIVFYFQSKKSNREKAICATIRSFQFLFYFLKRFFQKKKKVVYKYIIYRVLSSPSRKKRRRKNIFPSFF